MGAAVCGGVWNHYAGYVRYVSLFQSHITACRRPVFGRCIVLTLVCMATLIVYYTKGELSVRAWWFRTILHTCLLEITLLPLAHYWHFWYGPLDAVIYGSFILGAKILWHIVDFGQSMRTAAEVNERLRRRRMEPVEERREKMRKRH